MPQLLYQKWLNLELPAPKAAPMWSLPIVLADGTALMTFLFRPLTTPATPPRTVILELSPEGESHPWQPGAGYSAAVMFHAAADGTLFGFDLTAPEKVYACDIRGKHVATLAMTLKLANLLSPEFFATRDKNIFWINAGGQRRQGEMTGRLLNERAAENWPTPPEAIHFPHTHVIDKKLFVFDFDPMPRVSAYQL